MYIFILFSLIINLCGKCKLDRIFNIDMSWNYKINLIGIETHNGLGCSDWEGFEKIMIPCVASKNKYC